MTKEKLIKTLEFYKEKTRDFMQGAYNHRYLLPPDMLEINKLKHIQGMFDRIIPLIENQNKIEKGMRWLGFIQGVLYSLDLFTLEELKDHSRPEEEIKKYTFKDKVELVLPESSKDMLNEMNYNIIREINDEKH